MLYVLIQIVVFMLICGSTEMRSQPISLVKQESNIRYKNSLNVDQKNFIKSVPENTRVKRDSNEIDSDYLDSLDDEEDEDRQERGFEESSLVDEENEKEGAEDAVESSLTHDVDFQNEKVHAANITNTTKILFDEIENGPQKKTEEEKDACCDSNDEKDEKSKSSSKESQDFVAGHNKKLKSGPQNFVKMHLFKQVPSVKNRELFPGIKHFFATYPMSTKRKKAIGLSDNNYKYVTLLSQDSKLVEVPAVRYTMIPQENINRKSRTNTMQLFYHNYI